MNNEKKLRAVVYGEGDWDAFADEKKIGEALLNVALRMKTFGCEVAMINCVRNDEDREAVSEQVKSFGLESDTMVSAENFPTGLVNAALNKYGAASYDVSNLSAWDKIVLHDFAKETVADADVLIYGSLVCADQVSRQALEELLKLKVYKVFDVNLRKSNYSYEILEQLIRSSDFIKFNDQELLEISIAMDSPFSSLQDHMNFIAKRTKARSMCVTRGRYGALLMWKGKLYENRGYPVKVADTVGADDSFLAALITSLLTQGEPQRAIDFAYAVRALVAEVPGANPEISTSRIVDLLLKIQI